MSENWKKFACFFDFTMDRIAVNIKRKKIKKKLRKKQKDYIEKFKYLTRDDRENGD